MYVFDSGRRGCEWMIGLGLGFTNSVETGKGLDVCLCFRCGVMGGVSGEWVGLCYVCLSCES